MPAPLEAPRDEAPRCSSQLVSWPEATDPRPADSVRFSAILWHPWTLGRNILATREIHQRANNGPANSASLSAPHRRLDRGSCPFEVRHGGVGRRSGCSDHSHL